MFEGVTYAARGKWPPTTDGCLKNKYSNEYLCTLAAYVNGLFIFDRMILYLPLLLNYFLHLNFRDSINPCIALHPFSDAHVANGVKVL